MKALNRAIARTVSQINRITTPDDYYLPLLDKLTYHLDALLTMERKMLEGVQEVELAVTSDSCFAPQESQYWTPERVAVFNRWENDQPLQKSKDNAQPVPAVKLYGVARACHSSSYVVGGMGGGAGGVGILQPHTNKNAPPAPDVVAMADPRNWQAGDVVVRKIVRGKFLHFTSGKQYTVTSNGPDVLTIMGNDGVEVTYPHDTLFEPASNFFTWLRHGEEQS